LDFLRRMERYQGLTPTPKALFLHGAASRLEGNDGAPSGPLVRLGSCVVSLVFISSSSSLFERGEGLTPFPIAGARAPFRPTPAAAEPRCAKKGTALHSAKAPEPAEKDRPIDPMSGIEFVRERARSGVEPLDKRTGASPSCLKSISRIPAFGIYPFDFANYAAMRPLSVGRV
jgi:hypothetical protein